jgi:transcriptional regulator with XRE-family HTH domain
MKLGEKIRNLRINNSWTQKDLALRLGVAHNTVSDYERDTKAVAVATLEKLCDIFEVEMSYFLDNDSEVINIKDNKMMVEDILNYLIDRKVITDPNNIDKQTLDMIIAAIKKDISNKLEKQL